MAAETYLPQIPLWIDVTSVSIGAVSGALTATRLRFDVSGVLLVAIVGVSRCGAQQYASAKRAGVKDGSNCRCDPCS